MEEPEVIHRKLVRTLRSRNVYAEDSPQNIESPQRFECEFCNSEFQTVRGLKIHQNHAYPVEYHELRTGKNYSKCRLSEEESHMLARIELELKQEGCKNVNVEAQKKFQHRSLAAIRSHRRQSSYRKIFRDQSGDMGSTESRMENDSVN